MDTQDLVEDLCCTVFEDGIERGVQRGQRSLLRRLLCRRFGAEVDDDVERRIATASDDQIERWAEDMLSAVTLAEIPRLRPRLPSDLRMLVGIRGPQITLDAVKQGLRQGIEQGERKLLLRQLRRRFGIQIDGKTEHRVTTASAEQIELWADRVLSAATLAEILAD